MKEICNGTEGISLHREKISGQLFTKMESSAQRSNQNEVSFPSFEVAVEFARKADLQLSRLNQKKETLLGLEKNNAI